MMMTRPLRYGATDVATKKGCAYGSRKKTTWSFWQIAGDYILPWTAYVVEQPHRQRKLLREHDDYWRMNSQKS
jgi:hypothetical protein